MTNWAGECYAVSGSVPIYSADFFRPGFLYIGIDKDDDEIERLKGSVI